ncbi:MAG: hypothetical protein K2X47_09095 [Bdellovibrionales bacterium]|nr:hypothetical protein [Bdellovibrionales bacterium]
MQKTITTLLLICGFCTLPLTAFSFPEMIRHGYVNCTSCHVSPTGGGILTQYGRELSKELLSTWGAEGEQQFLNGALKGRPEWLNFGGDFRNLILYRETPAAKEGRVIQMQADLETAVSVSKFLIVSTFGYREPVPNDQKNTERFISRRHYVNYRPTEELSFRVGRFSPAFGINTQDHAIVTKRGLNWDQGSETYNLENAWFGEKVNVALTAIFGRLDRLDLKRETGVAATASYAMLDRYKLGASYFYGKNDLGQRQVYGPWGILGLTDKATVLFELDLQTYAFANISRNQVGYVSYNKFDYEFVQGFHGFLTQEFQNLDSSRNDQLTRITGIALQFFPRPHLDLSLSYQRHSIDNLTEATHLLFLLLHYYL